MRDLMHRMIGLRALAILTAIPLYAGLAGCASAPDPAPAPMPIPDLAPGEDRQDSLLPGGKKTLHLAVRARTFYAVWLGASGGSDIVVTLTGAPLAAPVEVQLASRTTPPTEPQGTFYAQSDGELQVVIANTAMPASPDAGVVDAILFGSDTPTYTSLRIDDLGADDHGETPDETTPIVPDGQSLGGTLACGETYDYFTLPVQLGELFNVRVEATHQMTLATANLDNFGQFNFGVATNAGNDLSLTATPGVPADAQFAVTATEPPGSVLLAVQATSDLLADPPLFADYPIEYAITVEQVAVQLPVSDLTPGEDRQDSLVAGGTSTFQLAVSARTFYAIWLSASGGSNISVSVTGPPLAAPIELSLSVRDARSTEPLGTFYTQSDGNLEIVISNNARTPGPVTTTLRIDDLGADDHGETPDETTPIVPDGQSLGGTLACGETYDYFTLPVQLGELFNVRVEATHQMTLATANIDSFGQFNFGVATNAGNDLSLTATPGVPAGAQFTVTATEPTGSVLLAAKVTSGLLADPLLFADYPIAYAITVEQVTLQQLESGDARSGRIEAGFSAQFFIDVPSPLDELHATLSGPDGLALYVRKGQPASFEVFDFYLVLGGGVATDTLTIRPPQIRADRYYLTIGNIVGQAADYILAVEIE